MGVGDAGTRHAPADAVGHHTAHAAPHAEALPHTVQQPSPATDTVQQTAPADTWHDDSCPAAPTATESDTGTALGSQAVGDDATEVHTGITHITGVADTTDETAVDTASDVASHTAVDTATDVASQTAVDTAAVTAVDTVVHEPGGNGCCSAHGRRRGGRRSCLLAVGRGPA
ncbi:hypothetical protein ACIPSA_30655 [Streptomyces sp. NPDC086549]|uniref:hypothetical protein n=1 Tax=Streptomyces sp. NPDC086549 TaxID=3365752 RepID=UPI003806451C